MLQNYTIIMPLQKKTFIILGIDFVGTKKVV